MRITKVGVIGVGFMGTHHAETYAAMPDAELMGVADIDQARAASVAEKFGIRAYEDMRQLLADPNVAAVSICTNDEQHVEPSLAALAAGKHVLLEKPIATTLGDADRVLAAANGSTKCFLVGHILRFEQRYVAAKQAVDAGQIGEVISIFARRMNAASAQNILEGRVSVLSFIGVHDLDLCHWIADAPAVRVYCEVRRGLLASRGFDVEDQTFTLVLSLIHI